MIAETENPDPTADQEQEQPDLIANRQADDEVWFAQHGWSPYKPGEENLLKMKGLR